MNIQKLNLEKLIIVNRVTENEYKRTQKKASVQQTVKKRMIQIQDEPIVTLIEEIVEEKPKRQYKRKTGETEETSEN
jgi:hypothetical protein